MLLESLNIPLIIIVHVYVFSLPLIKWIALILSQLFRLQKQEHQYFLPWFWSFCHPPLVNSFSSRCQLPNRKTKILTLSVHTPTTKYKKLLSNFNNFYVSSLPSRVTKQTSQVLGVNLPIGSYSEPGLSQIGNFFNPKTIGFSTKYPVYYNCWIPSLVAPKKEYVSSLC